MKICRFTIADDVSERPRIGLYTDDAVSDVSAIAAELPAVQWPLPAGDLLIAELPRIQDRIIELGAAVEPIARERVRLLSPVANPGKIICGLGNWKHHGVPLGSIGFLYKVTSALSGEAEGIQIRWPDRTSLHEPELAIVLGKKCVNVTADEALDYVAGYSCAFDTTLQKNAEDFSFCKSFDTYGTLGPCLVTSDEIPDPSTLTYKFWVDSELRGERNFSDLTGSPAELVAFASSAMTLYPGDIILSGAADVGPIAPGQTQVLEIPGIGRLSAAVTISPFARPT